jgi:hypothetical protein
MKVQAELIGKAAKAAALKDMVTGNSPPARRDLGDVLVPRDYGLDESLAQRDDSPILQTRQPLHISSSVLGHISNHKKNNNVAAGGADAGGPDPLAGGDPTYGP